LLSGAHHACILATVDIGAAQVLCAIVYVSAGQVIWSAAAPLGIGMLAGSSLVPRVVRRLPTRLLRVLIVLVGLTLAVWLWINPR
jgi:uncharacterized protein